MDPSQEEEGATQTPAADEANGDDAAATDVGSEPAAGDGPKDEASGSEPVKGEAAVTPTPEDVQRSVEEPTEGARVKETVATEEVPSDVDATVIGPELGIAGIVAVALAVGLFAARGRSSHRSDDASGIDDASTSTTAAPVPEERGLAARLRERMARSRAVLQERFDTLFGAAVDESTLEQLEEILLVADVGIPTATRIVDVLRTEMRGGVQDGDALRERMRAEIGNILTEVSAPFELPSDTSPAVMMVVGVNGSGKTTTIGKLAARFTAEGRSVLLVAGDTYRAAAAEQLEVWAGRAGAQIVTGAEGGDPGAVVYTAMEKALADKVDVVIVDTAGRLQTAKPLMEQLTKMRRIIEKKVPGGPHETMLVVDGTMGQNALSQARNFHEATPISGVVVTKLDGTAKGGMVLAIASEMKLPVKFIGIGEQVDDLRPFEPDAFAAALG